MTKETVRYNSKSVRLAEQLVGDIRRADFASGRPLPSEDTLVERYQVSRGTLQRALKTLCERGDLVRDEQKNFWIGSSVPVRNGAGEENGKAAASGAWFRIGVMLGGTFDQFFFELMSGIQQYCEENSLLMHRMDYGCFDEAVQVLRHAREHDIDGLLLVPFSGARYLDALKSLTDTGFPVVAIDREAEGIPLPLVKCDHAAGFYLSTMHLIRRHNRPVYYFGNLEALSSLTDGYEGYTRAMSEASMSALIDAYTFRVVFERNDVPLDDLDLCWRWPYRRAVEWLKSVTLPISVVTADDYSARGIYQAAEELGLQVGKDIFMIGFGDLPLCDFMQPGLSSVTQYSVLVGGEAVRLLHGILQGKIHQNIRKMMPVRLMERSSS